MEAVPWRIVKALEIDECRGTDSSLSTNACKPISKSVNQTPTHCPLLHTEAVESVCERERERERESVLPVPDSDLERVRLFVRTRAEVLDFPLS